MTARLGLGLAALGRPAYITTGRATDLPIDRSRAALRRRSHELLSAAMGLGIDYVDTARGYGLAEEFLAEWLRRTAGPDPVTAAPGTAAPGTAAAVTATPFVASKWGYRYTADWRPDAVQHEVKDHSAAMLDRQWTESTALLGRWLRLYQVHSLTRDSPLWTDAAALSRLAGIRSAGMEVGFSTSGPDQAGAIRRGLALRVDGVPLFTSVQSTWNLLERSAGPALADAHAAGARVVVKEALANGRLVGHPALAGEVPPDQLALAAAVAQPFADIVLTGAVTVGQLESNVRATDLELDADSFADLAMPPSDYWAARSRLPWG